jgi:hypothetical protein
VTLFEVVPPLGRLVGDVQAKLPDGVAEPPLNVEEASISP